MKRGADFDEAALWEASRVRIDWPPEEDAANVLRLLYPPDKLLFVGEKLDSGIKNILTAEKWIARFESGLPVPPHVIPNPLTGEQGLTTDGKPSYRADSCVAQFKLATVEFDQMPREKQIRFWAGAPLPVVALVDSGGKSIHGWVTIDAANADEWTRRVERKLFDFLVPCGADRTSKNEARLSRMPGHFRAEKNRWQRVLYLNPDGGPIL